MPTGLSGCCAPLQMLTSTSDMGRQGSIQSLKDEAYALRADRAMIARIAYGANIPHGMVLTCIAQRSLVPCTALPSTGSPVPPVATKHAPARYPTAR